MTGIPPGFPKCCSKLGCHESAPECVVGSERLNRLFGLCRDIYIYYIHWGKWESCLLTLHLVQQKVNLRVSSTLKKQTKQSAQHQQTNKTKCATLTNKQNKACNTNRQMRPNDIILGMQNPGYFLTNQFVSRHVTGIPDTHPCIPAQQHGCLAAPAPPGGEQEGAGDRADH